ncbi:hypothetical protein JN06_01359 [Bacteroides zoogleoformans]|uniref:Lipoprotein n=1 Tax=Bacteroides zoogleoformans TaxID=28119 RepID=A0ABN5IKC0_9BACE|nr:hypothetical protein [Bacteroides zoogleoformans]AVM53325.1 hypothetical protein C4H11_10635 [Bacteroides zoogleoformans]TWJ14426.1 hypothetical protein JN06_01359 [Bacteroides zoogleoformans]
MTGKEYQEAKRLLHIGCIAVILMMLMLLLHGCSSVRYVPVETTKIEYRTRDSIRYDSIYKHDSIYVLDKGDTVYKYIKLMEYRYLFINKTDTVLQTDSVQVPYPVEKKLTKWESVKLDMGGWMFGALIVLLLYILYRRHIK